MSGRRERRKAKTIEDLVAEDESRAAETGLAEASRAGKAYVPGDVGERRSTSKPPTGHGSTRPPQ